MWTLCKEHAASDKVKYAFTKNSAISFLDIHPREMKAHVHTKTGTQMFTMVIFIKTQDWKQLRCLPTAVNKVW